MVESDELDKYIGNYKFTKLDNSRTTELFVEQNIIFARNFDDGNVKRDEAPVTRIYKLNDNLYMFMDKNYSPILMKFIQNSKGKIVIKFLNESWKMYNDYEQTKTEN